MTVAELRDWMIAHLREEHGIGAGALNGNPIEPESFADLKAVHDFVHENARVPQDPAPDAVT